VAVRRAPRWPRVCAWAAVVCTHDAWVRHGGTLVRQRARHAGVAISDRGGRGGVGGKATGTGMWHLSHVLGWRELMTKGGRRHMVNPL
jgi:hypothetical protein